MVADALRVRNRRDSRVAERRLSGSQFAWLEDRLWPASAPL